MILIALLIVLIPVLISVLLFFLAVHYVFRLRKKQNDEFIVDLVNALRVDRFYNK